MEESSGAQYALQVALQTLRDRCQQFQQRVADLEEENLNLRSRCQETSDSSLPEADVLYQQIEQLTEQKLQLSKKVEMVTAENNNLWTRLSKLTQANENLDSKLTKINNSISNRAPHTHLVRSKTFTQDQPQVVFSQGNVQDESNKISLELEDISLKLLKSIAKEKQELKMQCSQMAEIQANNALFGNSYAFMCVGEEVTASVTEYDQLEKQSAALISIKFALLKQKEKLEMLENVISIRPNNPCARCRISKSTTSISVQTSNENRRSSLTAEDDAQLQSLLNWGTPNNSMLHDHEESPAITKECLNKGTVKICPMCSKIFYKDTEFDDFQQHVEHHFRFESATDYEIIS